MNDFTNVRAKTDLIEKKKNDFPVALGAIKYFASQSPPQHFQKPQNWQFSWHCTGGIVNSFIGKKCAKKLFHLSISNVIAACQSRPIRAEFLLFRVGFLRLNQTINYPSLVSRRKLRFEGLNFEEITPFRFISKKSKTLLLHSLEAKCCVNLSKWNSSSYQMFLLVFGCVVLLPVHFASQRRCPEEDAQ